MHRRYRALLASTALVCAAAPAGAQGLGMGMGAQDVVVRQGGGAVLGPGDIVNFTVWYGLRAYKIGVIKNSVKLRRASDSLELDIPTVANGDLDITLAQNHCLSTQCYVRWVYDQVGTYHLPQATPANQPEFVFNCQGTKPCIRGFNNASMFLQAAGPTPATGIVSLFAAAGSSTGGGSYFWQNGTGGNRIGLTANAFVITGGTSGQVISTVTGGAGVRVGIGIFNGASSITNENGTITTGTAVGSTTTSTVGGCRSAVGVTITCLEFGYVDNVVLTTAQQNALIANTKSYWILP